MSMKLIPHITDKIHGIAVGNNNTIYYTTGQQSIWHAEEGRLANVLVRVDDSELCGLIYDGNNSLYVCEFRNNAILQYDFHNGKISTLVGKKKGGYQDGKLEDALVDSPRHLIMDKKGNCILFTDRHHVRKINLSERTVETIAGSTTGYYSGYADSHKDGDALSAKFASPEGLTQGSDGTIYVCDSANYCIRKIKDGVVSTIAGVPYYMGEKDGIASQCNFWGPQDIVLDKFGNLFIGDKFSFRFFSRSEKTVATKGARGINCITQHKDGSVYFGTSYGILKLQGSWNEERLLWIGHLKEDASYCNLARLPKDIIREICSYFSVVTDLLLRN